MRTVRMLILLLAIISLFCLTLVGCITLPQREVTTHTGIVTGVVPASNRGIIMASSWYFICFQDGTEYYVRGKPDVLLGEEVTITFRSASGGWEITKIQ